MTPAVLTTSTLGPGLLSAMLRHWWLVVTCMVGLALLGFGVSSLQPERYAAAAQILLVDVKSPDVLGNVTGGDAERRLLTEARRLESAEVRTRASELMGGEASPGQIAQHVQIQASTTIDLLRIEATRDTAAGAAAMANAVAEAYQQIVTEGRQRRATAASEQLETYRERLQARVDELDARIAALRHEVEVAVATEHPSATPLQRVELVRQRLDARPAYADLQAERNSAFSQVLTIANRSSEVAVQAAVTGAGIASLDRAAEPSRPAQPQPLRDGALAGVFGLLAGCILAWWRADARQRQAEGKDAALRLGAPRLGEIPRVPALTGPAVVRPALGSAATEAYEFAAASLTLALSQRSATTVMLTSTRGNAGTTTAALQLAMASAKGDRRVILVDGDLRTRSLTRRAAAQSWPGLPDLASSSTSVEACQVPLVAPKSSREGAPVLVPAGQRIADPVAFFSSSAFGAALRRLEEDADLVLVDAPPLLSFADTMEMAADVGGIVLVVPRETTAQELEVARERLSFAAAPILGFLDTDIRPSRLRRALRWLTGAGRPAPAAHTRGARTRAQKPPVYPRPAAPVSSGSGEGR